MKPRKPKSNPPSQSLPKPKQVPEGTKLAEEDSLQQSVRKRWFRLAALVMPLALLLVLELVLRLLGYGYATDFFLESRVADKPVFIENQQFARRYFPPGLARSPEPTIMPTVKPPDTCRIFIFGESAAMGDPEPAFGFARILEVLLGGQYPGKNFEVVNVAMTAINSHVIRQIARDCAPRQGDVWIIYMGNNEVVGPFGAGTVFGAQTPSLGFIRASMALKATRVGQLFDDVRYRLTRKSSTPTTWEGMEMFLKQQIRQSDRRMSKMYEHFQKNLEDILSTGESAGARLVVSTVASNLKDCPPFGSLHRADLTAVQLAEWDKLYRAGIAQESATNHTTALAQYQQAARLDGDHAELHFRIGRCHWALGQFQEARESFEKARDLDTLRFRADRRINQIIREVAAHWKGRGVKLLDAVEVFARRSPHEIPGEEFLYEHVHFNFDGNYLLARNLAEQIDELLPASVTRSQTNKTPLLSAEECAGRLALTDYDRYQVAEEMLKRLQQPPFTHQLDHEQQEQRWHRLCSNLQTATRPEALARASALYKQALALAPDDWLLHEHFARLLQAEADLPGAQNEWRKVVDLMPYYAPGYYSLGNVLDAQGKSAEAVSCFEQALRARPDSLEARNGLGLALASQGKISEALAQYEKALRKKPDFAEARVNLGQLLAEQGKVDEAMAQYATVLRLNSNNVAAHINWGKLLAAQGKTAEAKMHYEAAVRIKPDNAVAHFNLGNTLVNEGQVETALTHFAEAVRLKPDFAEARYNFGLELARRGRAPEAVEQLAETVRLKPGLVEGHLNLGVALAKEGRFDEAIQQFEETLRLAPGNAMAKKFLEQAVAFRSKTP